MDFEAMAHELEASGDYRVLRRLKPLKHLADRAIDEQRLTGIILDVETTGIDPAGDEVIELGMIRFGFTPPGDVLEVEYVFSGFRQPLLPISDEITRITGITEEMVAGCAIDEAEVAAFISEAKIVIAHNAGFDRRFCERQWRGFEALPWACSLTEIDWKAEGFEGQKLGQLLAQIGLFHDGHRAVEDCMALLAVLNHKLESGETVLGKLLKSARQSTIRIWATGAPFEKKDVLKARGYRWSDGTDTDHKAWWIDVRDDAFAAEMTYLETEIYGWSPNLPTRRLNAYSRYSVRA